jgi:hypothetical protein
MVSSDDALSFFREWMNGSRKLGVNATLGSFAASGSGVIASLDGGTIWVWDSASGFSMHVPLEGATFKSLDPERGSGDPAFDEVTKEAGFKFFWEIGLPDGMIVVLSDMDMNPLSALL